MAGQFTGKVALVTGGASGIGRASALAFAAAGAQVVVADIAKVGGQQTVQHIVDLGGDALFARTDVSQEPAIAALVARTVQQYGRLDYAHNNAGIAMSTQPAATGATPTNTTLEAWNEVISVNLTSVFLCLKYEIPQMLGQGGGAIVNTASVAGLVGLAGAWSYTASKHGIVGLTKSAALTYATQHIRINAVCPGIIETPMYERTRQAVPGHEARMRAGHPMGRFGTAAEVAAAVVWLCSDQAAFITGQALPIDGGWVTQ